MTKESQTAYVVGVAASLLLFLVLVILDFVAYKQRFPHADAWTYLFK